MNNNITKIENRDFEVEQNEKCIICNVETDVPRSMHVDFRTNYIDGAGQLCCKCAVDLNEKNNLT